MLQVCRLSSQKNDAPFPSLQVRRPLLLGINLFVGQKAVLRTILSGLIVSYGIRKSLT